jgi:oxygen-dependent protoporphyrinogen oxidase
VRVAQGDGGTLDASACVIAAPAAAAASMLALAAPAAASDLVRIVHARAAVVALAYPADALADLPVGTGFVSAGGGRLVRACTWSSSKWKHLRGDPADLSDLELATAVHRELEVVMGLRHPPVEQRIHRFAAAIPQYSVGHLDRVGRIEAALPAHVVVAGGSYRGAGISACLRSGRAAADRVLRQLGFTADHHAVDLPARSLA